jgi:mannose-1-phosphate guanylyltransferase
VQTAEEHPSALVTFGIPPTFPSTGYGYIHRGTEASSRNGISICRVRGFREKPNADLAERFVVSGEYFWNSGIFVWKAAAVLNQLREQRPALYAAVQRIADAWGGSNRQAVLRSEYEAMEKVSIDFAVMEHAPEVLAAQAPYHWDDVGSWLALERMNPQDADGNTVLGEFYGVNTKGCVIVGDPGRMIGAIGVENLLIIQDGDATLVADRREESAVKKLVELLQQKRLEKYL